MEIIVQCYSSLFEPEFLNSRCAFVQDIDIVLEFLKLMTDFAEIAINLVVMMLENWLELNGLDHCFQVFGSKL